MVSLQGYFYKDIPYLIFDGSSLPFRFYVGNKWRSYKTYESMVAAIDKYIEIKKEFEL